MPYDGFQPRAWLVKDVIQPRCWFPLGAAICSFLGCNTESVIFMELESSPCGYLVSPCLSVQLWRKLQTRQTFYYCFIVVTTITGKHTFSTPSVLRTSLIASITETDMAQVNLLFPRLHRIPANWKMFNSIHAPHASSKFWTDGVSHDFLGPRGNLNPLVR